MFHRLIPSGMRVRACALRQRTRVTFRRTLAILALALVPGLAFATNFTDTVSGADRFVSSGSTLGGIASCTLRAGSHAYSARTLTTNSSAVYTFAMTAATGFSNGANSDPFLAVYAGTFNPANPTANLIACDDDSNGSNRPRFVATLQAGTTYVIVTTAWADGNLPGMGTYDVTPDVTLFGAPLLSNVTVDNVSATAATLEGTSSSAGTAFYVVQLAALPAPSVAQVAAGQQSDGAPATVAGNGAIAAATPTQFPLAPLASGLDYAAYLVVRDNQSPALSSVPSRATFSTAFVAPAAPTVGTATAGDGEATLTFTAPLIDGGTVVTGYTVTSSPGAIVATGTGSPITITGLSNGTAYTFTVTATNAAGTSAASAASNTVTPIGPATLGAFPGRTVAIDSAPVTLVAPTSPSAGAFTYTSSDPAVATVSGNVFTPVGIGSTVITATQAADGAYAAASTTATYAVGLATPAITGFDDLQRVYGQGAFDLADPKSTSPGAFTFTSSNPAVATVSGRRVTLVGPGTTTLTATQAATARYATASVTARLVVAGRPDPSKDPEVIASLQAQVDAALRFAAAQQANVRDRLRQRRSAEGAADRSSNGLAIGSPCAGSLQPSLLGDGRAHGWSLWSGGTVSTGDRDFQTGSDRFDARSDGVTLGADRAVGTHGLVGLALGGGWSDTDMGANGSTVDATQRAATLYGLWHGAGALFVDGQLGFGRLDYDLHRYSTALDTRASAQRDGSQVFGSVTFGYETAITNGRLTAYGRVDAGRSTLDAYRETGLGVYDLAYAEQDVDQRSIAVGLEGAHDVALTWASAFRPFWQLEYRNDSSTRSDASLDYVVLPSANGYRVRIDPAAASNWNIGLGADLALGNGLTFTAVLRQEVNVGMGAYSTLGLQLSYDFGGRARANRSAAMAANDGAMRTDIAAGGPPMPAPRTPGTAERPHD